jgi:hypothetical protein
MRGRQIPDVEVIQTPVPVFCASFGNLFWQRVYTFEPRVDRKKPDGTPIPNWIDLNKTAHFVLKTKQCVNL